MKGIFILLLTCFALQLTAQQPTLRFNKQGSFKIVQFTDLHYSVEKETVSAAALECINKVLDLEKPDLVVFTGDLVYSKPAKEGLTRVLKPVVDRKLPFAVVWGNHDDEQDLSRAVLQSVVEQMPGCLGKKTDGIPGESNYILTIHNTQDKDYTFDIRLVDNKNFRIKRFDSFDLKAAEKTKRILILETTEDFKKLKNKPSNISIEIFTKDDEKIKVKRQIAFFYPKN